MTTKPEMLNRIEATFSQLTPSEKRVASWMLAHAALIPFETAESVALTTGTSGITVGRFLRKLGYRNRTMRKACAILISPGMNERPDSATAAPALGSPPALPFAGGGCNHPCLSAGTNRCL